METLKLTKKRILEYLAEGKRFDDRGLDEYRKITIETGISNKAEGSARIRLGKTEVIVGVKLDVIEPFPDSPDSGVLITSAELHPMSSSRFEIGPPRIEAIELARIVDRGIRESGFIDFKKLCIKKGEKVWAIFIDIYSINDDGNLLDASSLGALVALKHARFPKYNTKEERVQYGEFTKNPLPLTKATPLAITVHKLGKSFILDPILEEEDSSEARLTLTISGDPKKPVINAMQKGNSKEIGIKEFSDMIDMAVRKWGTLYPKILNKIDSCVK